MHRLLWGSDWPRTQFEGTETYSKSRQFLGQLTGDEAITASVLASPRDLLHV